MEQREGRKIYNSVTMDIDTGEIRDEDSYIYYGPMALCDGEDGDGDEGGDDAGDFEGFDDDDQGDDDDPDVDDSDDDSGVDDSDDDDTDDPAKLKDQIAQLQARFEELSEMTSQSSEEGGQDDGPPQYEEQTFIQSDDELDSALNSSENLNKVLNSAVQTAIQHVYKGIPGVIKNNVAQQVQLQETVSEFYSRNPELKKHRSFVGKVSERIMSENPNWSMQKVLEETSKEARKRLKLKQKAGNKSKNPGFAKGKGGKKGNTGKLSGQEKEVADMLSLEG